MSGGKPGGARAERRVWAVEVQYTPADGRHRPWMRSTPFTYTDAKTELERYRAHGHRARLVQVRPTGEEASEIHTGDKNPSA